MFLSQKSGELRAGGSRQALAFLCIAAVAAALSLGCKSKDKKHAGGSSGSETSESQEELSTAPKLTGQKVVLRLSDKEVIVEGKNGKKTFKLSGPRPSAQEVKPIIDRIFAEGAENGSAWIWGRYDAPYVYDVIGSALTDVPTRLCLRDGSNCSD